MSDIKKMKRLLPKHMLPKNELVETILKFKKTFWTVGVFSACINFLMLAPSIYMMDVYDRVFASRNEYTLLMLTIIVMAMYLIMGILEHVRSMVLIHLGEDLDNFLNSRIYTAAFEQNLKRSGMNAGQAMSDMTTIRQFLTNQGIFAFFDLPWFPIFLLLNFVFNFWMGVFATFGTLVLIVLAYFNELATHQPLMDANSAMVRSVNQVSNNLRNAEVIDAMGMLPNVRKHWYSMHAEGIKLQTIASKRAAMWTAITKTWRIAIQSIMLGVGALFAINGIVSGGMMVAASVLLGRATQPVEMVVGIWKQWSQVVSAYHRLNDLLEANPVRKESLSLPAPSGILQVENVVAAPPGAKLAVLKGISFGVNPGDVLGILGPSGSGKSTLARLLVGVWPCAQGKVRLDGADIHQWNKDELGPSMGYLPQDIELFAGTIAQNISRFGDLDSEKVVTASQLAGVHELILRFPDGYETQIGDGGAGLSGGERQRIGLARALYGSPSFIVLDEPNSNLDEQGEVALSRTIAQLRDQGKTVVIISHRPSIIGVTTKLLILKDGLVQAFGPTQAVMQALAEARKQMEAKALEQATANSPQSSTV